MKSALKVVHIHRQAMTRNIKAGCNREPVVVGRRKHSKRHARLHSNCINLVDDKGRVVARVVADVRRPLDCGARTYIEIRLRLVDGDDPKQEVD